MCMQAMRFVDCDSDGVADMDRPLRADEPLPTVAGDCPDPGEFAGFHDAAQDDCDDANAAVGSCSGGQTCDLSAPGGPVCVAL